MHDTFKFAYHKLVKKKRRWYPILAVYYVTYKCDFRCWYCSDGDGNPYYCSGDNETEVDEVLKILAEIRKYCGHLVLTGGEPLLHTHIGEILKGVKALGFRSVSLTTNGYLADRYLTELERSVDQLVFSIDTLNEELADNIYKKGRGVFRKIMSNLEAASLIMDNRIMISNVITPELLDEAGAVYEFSKLKGYTYAACPQLQGVKAHPNLRKSDGYKLFFDYLIRRKKSGAPIFGTLTYLRHMRDFQRFKCHPFTMLTVAPDGSVYYPCLEKGRKLRKIHTYRGLSSAYQDGESKYGVPGDCGRQCHSACALSFSLLIEKPLSFAVSRHI